MASAKPFRSSSSIMGSAKPFRSSSSIMASVKSSSVVQVLEKEKKNGWGGESAEPPSVEQSIQKKKGWGGEWAKPPIPKSSSVVVEQFLEENKKKKRGSVVVEEKTKLGPPNTVLALPAVENPRRTTTNADESSHLMFKKPPVVVEKKPRNESNDHLIKKPPSSASGSGVGLAGHKRKLSFSDDEAVGEFLAATERAMSRRGLILGSKKPKPSSSTVDEDRPFVRIRIRRYDGPCRIVKVFVTHQMHQFLSPWSTKKLDCVFARYQCVSVRC